MAPWLAGAVEVLHWFFILFFSRLHIWPTRETYKDHFRQTLFAPLGFLIKGRRLSFFQTVLGMLTHGRRCCRRRCTHTATAPLSQVLAGYAKVADLDYPPDAHGPTPFRPTPNEKKNGLGKNDALQDNHKLGCGRRRRTAHLRIGAIARPCVEIVAVSRLVHIDVIIVAVVGVVHRCLRHRGVARGWLKNGWQPPRASADGTLHVD